MIAGNIHRHIAGRIRQLIQQQAGLHAAAAAELHQQDALAEQRGHVRAVVAHDLQLGTRGVVLGQLADLIEQRRALGVIEILGRQAFLCAAEAVDDFPGDRVIAGVIVLQGQGVAAV